VYDYDCIQIASNHGKDGFCVNVCVHHVRFFLIHMCVCVTVCTHIYYTTDLHAYGSEALDRHNDGDSMKTRRGFKPEEMYWDVGREWRELIFVIFAELCVCLEICQRVGQIRFTNVLNDDVVMIKSHSQEGEIK